MRRFIHVKLVNQPLVGLAAEIPQPDFSFDAATRCHKQLPLRRPGADRRIARLPVVQR